MAPEASTSALPAGVALPGRASPTEAARLSAEAESAGCEAVWTLEVRRDPFLLAAAAAGATNRVEIGTNVAVAFARSPTVTAIAAWDLSLWSGGRFVLGLGSQVGPTLEARFGVSADHPAARMRDYVQAVRACFGALGKGYGGYSGQYYSIRRPAMQPGAEPLADEPPVYLGAVNPLMTRVTGEVGDGLAAHSFSTEEYLREVVRPALEEGAARAGRPRPKILLQLVVAPSRQAAAAQMYFYTVPGYRRVLDHSGLSAVADRIIAAAGEGRRSEARELIDQHLLDRLGVVIGDDPETLEAGLRRWRPHADRISLSVPWFGIEHEEQVGLFERLLRSLREMNAR